MLFLVIFVIIYFLLDVVNVIYYVKVVDDEVGFNGCIKYRWRLLEKVVEF